MTVMEESQESINASMAEMNRLSGLQPQNIKAGDIYYKVYPTNHRIKTYVIEECMIASVSEFGSYTIERINQVPEFTGCCYFGERSPLNNIRQCSASSIFSSKDDLVKTMAKDGWSL